MADEQQLEVTRREFMRRAGMVSGLTAFGVLGVDALLDAVLGRMKAIRATQGIATFVGREAHEVGLLSGAEAGTAGPLSDYVCGNAYSLYCHTTSIHNCSDSDFDCGPSDGLPNGFKCESGNWEFGQDGALTCTVGIAHACSPGTQSVDFTCHVQFTCAGTRYNCGNQTIGAGQGNEFACDPSSGRLFKCQASGTGFSCWTHFWCADESNVGCSDSEFHCTSIYGGCKVSYNCSPASSFDGVC